MASISTEIFIGSELEPTANRACFPWSPNILTRRSDAPLIICGWLVKLALQLTNPPSLMNPSNCSQSLLTALLRAAIIFTQQSSAALMPSSIWII